jgi:hypothetical protein
MTMFHSGNVSANARIVRQNVVLGRYPRELSQLRATKA